MLVNTYLPPHTHNSSTFSQLLTAAAFFFVDLDWVEEWSLPQIPKLVSKGAAVLAEWLLEGSAVGGIKKLRGCFF